MLVWNWSTLRKPTKTLQEHEKLFTGSNWSSVSPDQELCVISTICCPMVWPTDKSILTNKEDFKCFLRVPPKPYPSPWALLAQQRYYFVGNQDGRSNEQDTAGLFREPQGTKLRQMLSSMCGEGIEEIKRHTVSYIYHNTLRRAFSSYQQQLIISWIYCETIIEILLPDLYWKALIQKVTLFMTLQ